MSRFFPRASTASTDRPDRWASATEASGERTFRTVFPVSTRSSVRAARWMVSPSGIGSSWLSALSCQLDLLGSLSRNRFSESLQVTAAARQESGFLETRCKRRAVGLLSVDPGDQKSAPAAGLDGLGKSRGDGVRGRAAFRLRFRQKGHEVALRAPEISHEGAVLQDDLRSGPPFG